MLFGYELMCCQIIIKLLKKMDETKVPTKTIDFTIPKVIQSRFPYSKKCTVPVSVLQIGTKKLGKYNRISN